MKVGSNEIAAFFLLCLTGAPSQSLNCPPSYVIFPSTSLSTSRPFSFNLSSSMVFSTLLCHLMWPKYYLFLILISSRSWSGTCSYSIIHKFPFFIFHNIWPTFLYIHIPTAFTILSNFFFSLRTQVSVPYSSTEWIQRLINLTCF